MTLATLDLAADVKTILGDLGVKPERYTGGTLAVRSPVTGAEIGRLPEDTFRKTVPRALPRQSMRPMTPSSNGASCRRPSAAS